MKKLLSVLVIMITIGYFAHQARPDVPTNDPIETVIEDSSTRYILELRLRQERFSLNPFSHMKDAMNAIEFEIPVDKEFYDSVKEKQDIVNDFRSGSFIMEGTWSDWTLKVIKKRTITQ